MRALAALNMRQFERTVRSQIEYFQTIERGLQIVLKVKSGGESKALQPHQGRLGAIVFGSDQGLCGSFNEQIVAYALKTLATPSFQAQERGLLAVGIRVARHLEEAQEIVEDCLPTPSSRTGITVMAQDLLVKIEAWQQEKNFQRIVLFHQAFLPASGWAPHARQLLPIDLDWLSGLQRAPWPARTLPFYTMEVDQLFSHLIRQYLFLFLARALAESLACENASRLAAMQGAERNIEEHRDALMGEFQQKRQSSITEELLDIVGGFEVLTQSQSNRIRG